MNLSENIIALRKEKGISQKQLSEMTGIPVQSLVRYEKDASNMKASRIYLIAQALDVKPSELIGFEENELVDG